MTNEFSGNKQKSLQVNSSVNRCWDYILSQVSLHLPKPVEAHVIMASYLAHLRENSQSF